MDAPVVETLVVITFLVSLAVLFRRLRSVEADQARLRERLAEPGALSADEDAFAAIEMLARLAAGVDAEAGDEGQRAVDPIRCAEEAREMLADRADQRGVAIHELYDPVPRITANPALITLVVRDMLAAAIEAAPEGKGDVTLAVGVLPNGTPEPDVAIGVADDGPGEEAHNRLRETVTATVVGALGAKLHTDSEPGAGNRATLRLPAHSDAKTPEPRVSN
jgi:signal transduction histidine kinase